MGILMHCTLNIYFHNSSLRLEIHFFKEGSKGRNALKLESQGTNGISDEIIS